MNHQIQEKNSHFLGKRTVKSPQIKLEANVFWWAARVAYVPVKLKRNCQSKNPMLTRKKILRLFPQNQEQLMVETKLFEVFILLVVPMFHWGFFLLGTFSAWGELETRLAGLSAYVQ